MGVQCICTVSSFILNSDTTDKWIVRHKHCKGQASFIKDKGLLLAYSAFLAWRCVAAHCCCCWCVCQSVLTYHQRMQAAGKPTVIEPQQQAAARARSTTPMDVDVDSGDEDDRCASRPG